MMKYLNKLFRLGALLVLAATVSSCSPNVYGSIGVSSWGGYGGGPSASISIGGRICC